MSDFASIKNLTQPTDDEESVAGRFAKKQEEIRLKKIEKETKELAASLGLEYINFVRFPLNPEALSLSTAERAKSLGAVPFFYEGQNIYLACLAWTSQVAQELDRLKTKNRAAVKVFLISPNSLNIALEAYKSIPSAKRSERGFAISEASLEKFQQAISDYRYLSTEINRVNVTDIITLILATALKVGGSDVHIEAEEAGVAVRIRIDGVLQEAALIQADKWPGIISRLKILAKVKINITSQPQDGRFTIRLAQKNIEVRCSFLPTAFGESVVLRILDSSITTVDFANLGLRPEIRHLLEKEISKPNGLILTVGPTGSGKTTTLYAIINRLNQPGTKIITLEDPIEYQLTGINQSQVDVKGGYTFSSGLYSILRQDPNIIMIGEIRDLETAEIAVQSSLTGHLVLSTLHTNDAAGTIPRLIDIGVKPYFLAPSINAIIGQRLVRKLCQHCRIKHALSNEEKEQVNKILGVISPKANISVPPSLPDIYAAGPGCAACNGIGYQGRIGIFEIFTLSEKVKQLAVDQAISFKILQQAVEDGMITMLQDGVLKVLDGITSLAEVYRVVGDFDYINELYEIVISQTIGRGVKISPAEYQQASQLGRNLTEIAQAAHSIPSNQLINLIMALGAVTEAGDIHIEPTDQDVKVRFRIDGVLQDILNLPKTSYLPLLAELKILAGTPTNIKKATFDGRFTIYLPENKIDCRLSIVTGGFGETIVIRLLPTSAFQLDMVKLGIAPIARTSLQAAMKKTRGIIITAGPTGSGKTTTLYSILNELNRPDVKIITVEDPIEYQLPGIMQTQIDEERGYTFAAAMRSLLRQNPNIMMIGEIRDSETAKIATEASMTGHLVLSTIHANSAAGAISRFVGLGLDRQMLANAINFTIGQRLVRRLCPHCRQAAEPSEAEMKKVREVLSSIKNREVNVPAALQFYGPKGCEQCGQLGYKGRLGLYETIEMNETIQKVIQAEGVTDVEIEAAAVSSGTITMLQDGVLKALAGDTSVAEVFRVI